MLGRLFITIVIGLLIASSASAGTVTNWELAYAHDGQGVRTSGDINALISAVKSGADVRVISQSPLSGETNHAIDSATVDLTNSIVTGIAHDLYSNPNDPNGNVYIRLITYSTTGILTTRYQNASNLNNILNYHQSWYVNK